MSGMIRVGFAVSALNLSGPSAPIPSAPTEPAAILPESKIDQLMASGDVGAMISAMLLESGARSRDAARASKDAALQAEEAAIGKKLAAMEDAAEKKLIAGIATASATASEGAMTMVGGLTGKTAIYQGGGSIGKGGWQGVSAVFEYQSDMAERDVAKAEREITQAKRGVENASDDEKDARDLLGRALDHYKEFMTAKEDAKRAALVRA